MIINKLQDTTSIEHWISCPDCGFCFVVRFPISLIVCYFDMVICPNCGSTF